MDPAADGPCYTCRNRRIQCDQTGVPCAKCEKAGLECLDKRPFRWVKGVAIRGRMQGRMYDANKDAEASHAKRRAVMKSNATKRGPKKREDHFSDTKSLPIILHDPSTSRLDRKSHYYIDYFNDRICKLFIVYDSNRNPIRSLIPMGYQDPVLMKALLALAARHHVNTGHSFHQTELPASSSLQLSNANQDALLFKHQAMEALSYSLRDTESFKKETTVASIFLLIFLDLLESGSDGWNFHLQGAKNLIASTFFHSDSNLELGQTIEEIRGFIIKQIDLWSLSTQRDNLAETQSPLDEISTTTFRAEIKSLIEMIGNFDSYNWATKLQQSRNPSPQEILGLCNLSESYKLGAQLYAGRILDALAEEPANQNDLVTELLGVIDSLRDDKAIFKCILWPIFVAGLECQWQAQRDFVISCIERFWDLTNCLNGVNAAKILQDYWQKESSTGNERMQWIFSIGELGRDWLWI
ncbi:hypothetical protein N7450_009274 [Penicillium hetheringtonii]|uniref:Zn(2)-C6 fungal-type domain-containing protein n=1 Tax=Penicillium hetheringtonii TaxID=911720 RepID=A0AAD6DEM5_9EURO|nr:hypothetical protein N7450_009274 [Penicillium hetheringtonii]